MNKHGAKRRRERLQLWEICSHWEVPLYLKLIAYSIHSGAVSMQGPLMMITAIQRGDWAGDDVCMIPKRIDWARTVNLQVKIPQPDKSNLLSRPQAKTLRL